MRIRHVSALVALALLCEVATAQTCYVYRKQASGVCSTWVSAAEAAQCWVDAKQPPNACVLPGPTSSAAGSPVSVPTWTCSATNDSATGYTLSGSGASVNATVRVEKIGGGQIGAFGFRTQALLSQTTTCPEPEECSGDKDHGVGDKFTTTTYPGADGYCHALSKCKMAVTSSVSADGATVYQVTHTNENCSSDTEPPGGGLNDGETCFTTGSGNEFCLAKEGKNCGFFNDNFVCLTRLDDDGCKGLADGSRLCGGQAPVPPVPDSGTPGVAATPDETVTTDTGDTYNYYNSATVAGSSRPVTGSGDNPYDGDDGNPEGDEVGDGGPSNGLLCESGEGNCTEEGNEGQGDDPRGGWDCWADGDGLSGAVAACYEAATNTMWETLVDESSLLSVANATAAAFSGGGSCPSDVVTLAGEEFDVWEVPCTFLAQVESFLGPLMLLFWGFVSLRILLTIPGGE